MKHILVLLALLATSANAAEVTCLTKVIYYEARGESRILQEGVAKVVLNRVKSKAYPNDICSVVYQPYQFTWTLNKNRSIKELEAWHTSHDLAYRIIHDGYDPYPWLRAMWFHDNSMTPYWARNLKTEVVRLPFIFYRSK